MKKQKIDPDSYTYPWDSQKHNWHNVRVICDKMGLTYNEKNVICACIYQESWFTTEAVNRNRNKQGKIMSTDWGIVQINDYWHIGKNKSFPSVDYVINNPDECVKWMVKMYLNGRLSMWVSYSSGAYVRWLRVNSPMWKLKNNK